MSFPWQLAIQDITTTKQQHNKVNMIMYIINCSHIITQVVMTNIQLKKMKILRKSEKIPNIHETLGNLVSKLIFFSFNFFK